MTNNWLLWLPSLSRQSSRYDQQLVTMVTITVTSVLFPWPTFGYHGYHYCHVNPFSMTNVWLPWLPSLSRQSCFYDQQLVTMVTIIVTSVLFLCPTAGYHGYHHCHVSPLPMPNSWLPWLPSLSRQSSSYAQQLVTMVTITVTSVLYDEHHRGYHRLLTKTEGWRPTTNGHTSIHNSNKACEAIVFFKKNRPKWSLKEEKLWDIGSSSLPHQNARSDGDSQQQPASRRSTVLVRQTLLCQNASAAGSARSTQVWVDRASLEFLSHMLHPEIGGGSHCHLLRHFIDYKYSSLIKRSSSAGYTTDVL